MHVGQVKDRQVVKLMHWLDQKPRGWSCRHSVLDPSHVLTPQAVGYIKHMRQVYLPKLEFDQLRVFRGLNRSLILDLHDQCCIGYAFYWFRNRKMSTRRIHVVTFSDFFRRFYTQSIPDKEVPHNTDIPELCAVIMSLHDEKAWKFLNQGGGGAVGQKSATSHRAF